ncbi:baseplate J/gp47 family protein [Bordetella genomosp. 1]|uniref:Baseplate protein J-like barrel domain-containing protein n=1 Tax=Bordetella genomosp. 1 TaxID=1395607 RepID=A0ABX4EXH6_9BORD|nr:baseplate J/gp47 family protein [Bordetella genomosp. 1]MDQ8034974.1 baseplate J/gp47 family protein [Bordetella sp.]OZI57866.1 hypothetical protein CAL27_20925 [Bordetella genomosp. 1]
MAITSTAPVIDATGIHAPTYADVFEFLQTQFRAIYGEDAYLDPDSQDGQLLAVFAKSISDSNAAAIQVYNSFSPATAVGEALSSNVRINGIARATASSSTADLRLVGQVGTRIVAGRVRDAGQALWALPAEVVIPPAGEITVTATCLSVGALRAAANTINQIATPTRGWQSVTNPAPAVPGAPVETDAALRVRQARSVALPSLTVLDGIAGAVAAVPGVLRHVALENDTSSPDAHGLPPHTIAVVVEGGDASAIAQAIARKKTPGTGTYGTTTEQVADPYGRVMDVRFFRPTDAPVSCQITIKALPGYSTLVGEAIRQAVVDYVNAVPIGGGLGEAVEWGEALSAANAVDGSRPFRISSFTLSGPRGAGTPDVALLFNEAASCNVDAVTLTVA